MSCFPVFLCLQVEMPSALCRSKQKQAEMPSALCRNGSIGIHQCPSAQTLEYVRVKGQKSVSLCANALGPGIDPFVPTSNHGYRPTGCIFRPAFNRSPHYAPTPTLLNRTRPIKRAPKASARPDRGPYVGGPWLELYRSVHHQRDSKCEIRYRAPVEGAWSQNGTWM